MLATNAKPDRVKGKEVMVVDEAQIVNGQQTTRVLEVAGKAAKDVSVLVRVIEVPPGVLVETDKEEGLTSRIVKATNRQNKITAADLKSNHPKQVWLEQELEKLGYRYLRKKEARSETAAGPRAKEEMKKGDLARAVATCINERWGLGGEEPRFDSLYDKIFWSSDPWYYALCFAFFKRVTDGARGSQTWARFVVVHFLWSKLETELRTARKVVVPALRQVNRAPAVLAAVDSLIESAMTEAVAYYLAKARSTSGQREDAQKFFKREAYDGFEKWWRSQANQHRRAFGDAKKELIRAIKTYDAEDA